MRVSPPSLRGSRVHDFCHLTQLALWIFAAVGCDVYDPSLLDGTGTVLPRDGGAGPDASDHDDGGITPALCIPLDDPACPLYCPETCNQRDDDCDGIIDEEGTTRLCRLSSATSVCSSGKCVIASCEGGHVDCNGDALDGCEDALDTVVNCGICGHRCILTNADAACEGRACVIQACKAGFADCDKNPDNGCERALNTLSDCGACGVPCSSTHATTDCSDGTCKFSRCSNGFGDCNQDGPKLAGGNGCESELNTPEQCGACGMMCPAATPYCSGGTCSSLSCPADSADCDGDNVMCETSLRSVDNCGACGSTCGTLDNATVSCSDQGTCVATCNSGFTSCDESISNGCETNIRTTSNCGDCGVTCTYANASTSCATGGCGLAACNNGYGNCNDAVADGCEQRLNTTTHCNQCNKACGPLANAAASCDSGSCGIASCNSSYGNCDGNAANGCEANLNTNAANCGSCGTVCPLSFSCVSGRCACTSDLNCLFGQTCCNGACVDMQKDAGNCGKCGSNCGTGGACCSGTCKNLQSDVSNCGMCGYACNDKSNRCSNGSCRCANDAPCNNLYQCCSDGCKFTLFCN